MSAPFLESLSTTSFVVLALILGFLFGFFLERAGFSSARKLTAQFYFKDFSVLKVMFTAIVVAMLGIVYFSLFGWLDMGAMYIPGTFLWPQLVGGLLLGAGFIMGGYCPGTSVAAAAIGKIDALFFMAGILIGIFLFGAGFHPLHAFYLSGSRGALTIPQWLDLNSGVVALAIALVALAAFWASEMSEGPWNLYARTYGKKAYGKTADEKSA
jgi:uncharacterized membrane protein YedE/YeeE